MREGSPERSLQGSGASRQLDMEVEHRWTHPRKRKSKVAMPTTQTPDLNIPLGGLNVIVPVRMVSSRVNQLDNSADSAGSSMIETLKKQKWGNPQNARLAVAA